MYSIVTRTELVKVHNAEELIAACADAGIGIVEVTFGMVSKEDGLYLKVEETRRIPDVRSFCLPIQPSFRIPKGRNKGAKKTVSSRPAEGRILELANAYAAIPAAFDDRLDNDYSPADN